MSKMEGARPASNIASRAGLARYRQLQEQPAGVDQPQKTSLPNGWFYNEAKQEEFWQDLEGVNPNLAKDGSEQDQNNNFSDITTCANRVQSLLSEFDALDQDTLMELMEIVEQDNNLGDIDQYSFMSDAKNNVLINIDEIKEFAESQSVLMNTIKNWLVCAQNSINVETNDPITQESLPSIDHVYTNLADILKSYTERSEKVAFLHNDVNEFWSKQTAQLKKIIYARDEEIRKLQATLQAALAQKQRKNNKKNKQNPNESDSQLQQQVDQQTKIIQEQKTLIERLRSQLQLSESEKIIAQIGNQPNADGIGNFDAFASQKNLELESKNSVLNKKIEDLLNEMEKIRVNLTNEKEKNSALNKQLADKEQAAGEMEILLQKYLNQLSLEKNKPTDAQPPEDKDLISKEELYITEMKYKEKIQEIKASHAQALIEQAEMLEQKFQREKDLLLEAIQSPDNPSALKSLIDEYNSKFEDQKKEYNKMLENIKNNWVSKVALLARQYETRINKLNTSHEFELINAQNSVKYEVKKSELDLTEKFNQDLLKMTSEKTAKINAMQDDIDKKSDTIFSLQKQLALLQQKISHIESVQPTLSESKNNENQENKSQKSQESDEVTRYASRFNTLKSTLDEQHIWDLNMQKNFYEHELTKKLDQKQKEIRSLLIDFQDAVINKSEPSENEDEKEMKTKKVDEVVEKVVSVLSSLNEQHETEKTTKNDSEEDNEEKMPLSEARKRTSALTERIICLNNKIDELEHAADSASTIPRLEEMIERLRGKIKFLEDLQNGDQKKLTERFNEMEAKYLEELRFKEDLIKEMQDSLFSRKKELNNSAIDYFYISLNDSMNESEYDYEEDLLSERQKKANDKSTISPSPSKAEEKTTTNQAVPNKPLVSTASVKKIRQKPPPKQFRLKQQKRNLYNIETQISLDTPIVEAALKSILDHLTYNKCDSFTIMKGIIDFKDSKSIPLHTVQLPKSSTFKLNAFKNKLYFSSVFAFHRDDNFVSFPIVSEPSIQIESDKLANSNSNSKNNSRQVKSSANSVAYNSNNGTANAANAESANKVATTNNATSATTNNASNNGANAANANGNASNTAADATNATASNTSIATNNSTNSNNNNANITSTENGNASIANTNNTTNINDNAGNTANAMNPNVEDDEDTYTDASFNVNSSINNFNSTLNIIDNNNNNNNNSFNEIENNDNSDFIKHDIINSDYVNDYNSQSSSNNISSRRAMKRSRYVLCSIPPVKQEPIVIVVDEKQKEAIEELQSKLKEVNNDSRKKFLNDIIVECSNRHIETINKLKKVVFELANIQQQVIYQSTCLAIEDKPDPLAEYREHQSKKIKMQMQMNASIQARMKQIQNRVRTQKQNENVSKNMSSLELPSILESQNGTLMNVIGLGNDLLSAMSSRVVKNEPKNVVKKREPIQFIPPPEEPIPEDKLVEDPFTEAIQASIANMRYIAQMKDNENEIMNTLRNDYTAYEAFLRASKLFNDNNASFIENLKDVKESIEKVITSYDVFSKMQKGLLDLVRQSKKKAIYMAKMYTDLQKKVSEKLSIQSKSLASIKVDDTPAFIIDKIGTVIDVIDKLEISMTAEESVNFSDLKAKYEKMKPSNGKEATIDKGEADKFLIKTQDFIEGLKRRQCSSSESSEVDKSQMLIEISQNEIRTVKKKLKVANHDLEKAKRELAYAEETVNAYKDMINSMKESLKSEKEDNEQSRLMYQAQIRTLKELLKSFEEYRAANNAKAECVPNESKKQNDEDTSSSEIIIKIKQEVLNMQALLDSQTVELSDSRSKLREMQISANENEILINQLKHNLDENEVKFAELDDKYRKQKDINIFKEVDTIKETKEKGNKKGIEKLQRKQLEKAQADQEMLIDRLQKVEKKLIKTRKALNKATNENDELKMRFALKKYETMSSIVKLSVATQTMFRLVVKKKVPNNDINNSQNNENDKVNDNSTDNSKGNDNDGINGSNQNENEVGKDNEINNKSEDVNTENKLNDTEKVSNNQSNVVNKKSSNLSKSNSKEEHNLPLNVKSSNLSCSSKIINASGIDLTEMEWVEEEEEENDMYNESGVFSTDNPLNGSSKSEIMDDLFIEVHQPLLLTNRDKKKTNRNKVYMLSDPSKKKKTPKVVNAQKKIIIPNADAGQLLTIGFDEKHPYRPNSSMGNEPSKGRKRPYTSSVNPTNYAGIISKQQQPDLSVSATRMSIPDSGRVNTTRTANSVNSNNKGIYARLPPKIPSLSSDIPARPTTTSGSMQYRNVSGNEEESFDTLRITNIQFAQQNDGKEVSYSPPIIDVSSRTTINGPLVTFSKNVRTSAKANGNDEIKFLINRMRDKLKKLTKSNEKKERIIADLNKRLSEMTMALNRAKIDAIRSKDEETRCKIRFENANQRLSAAMDELVARQEENSALRRQLIHLNNAALPAMPLLRRMQKAKDEQERINNQQNRTRNLIEEKKKIYGNATDDSTRSHINSMIRNSMDSLLRMEAKRRYWQEVEKKQIVGALGALSLLSQDVPDLQKLGIPYTSIFRSVRTARGTRGFVPISPRQNDENEFLGKEIEIVSLEKKETAEGKRKKGDENDENEEDEDENGDDENELVYKPLSEDLINKIMKPLSDDTDDDDDDDSDDDGIVGDDDDDDDDDDLIGDLSSSDDSD